VNNPRILGGETRVLNENRDRVRDSKKKEPCRSQKRQKEVMQRRTTKHNRKREKGALWVAEKKSGGETSGKEGEGGPLKTGGTSLLKTEKGRKVGAKKRPFGAKKGEKED